MASNRFVAYSFCNLLLAVSKQNGILFNLDNLWRVSRLFLNGNIMSYCRARNQRRELQTANYFYNIWHTGQLGLVHSIFEELSSKNGSQKRMARHRSHVIWSPKRQIAIFHHSHVGRYLQSRLCRKSCWEKAFIRIHAVKIQRANPQQQMRAKSRAMRMRVDVSECKRQWHAE